MAISFQTFQDFVTQMSARWAGEVGVTPVLVSGDPLLAIFQAAASQMVFLEGTEQLVIAMARLSTSSGTDVDTFVADFGLTRLPATFATGTETFSTVLPATQQILIPNGTIVQTQGGAIQYQVVADSDNPNYSPTQLGYLLQAGQTSVDVTIQAITAGANQNVQQNQLVQFGSIITGITTATNGAAITNGLDPETDAALKARFILFFAGLSKATEAAILFAINTVQQNLDVVLYENVVPITGAPKPGFFFAVIDDGSGNPPDSLLNAIANAVNAVRAFTIEFAILRPIVVQASVFIQVHSNQTLPNLLSQAALNVQVAIQNYINGLKITQPLNRADIVDVAFAADPSITNVNLATLTIDGQTLDIIPTNVGLIRQATLVQTTVALY